MAKKALPCDDGVFWVKSETYHLCAIARNVRASGGVRSKKGDSRESPLFVFAVGIRPDQSRP
jgi:hypothetical protein